MFKTVRPTIHQARLRSIVAGRANRRRGFTLLEMMIVIGIILALGGLILVNVLGAGERADIDIVKVKIDGMEAGLDMFKYDMKRYPSEDEGLRALMSAEVLEDESDAQKWKGPYLQDYEADDTWGNEWIYRNPSELIDGADYDIISLGPDGEEGTEDDITNHDDKKNAEGDFVADDDLDSLAGDG